MAMEDGPREGPEVQHPIMRVVHASDGESDLRGVDVLDELIALIDSRLPLIPADDPLRSHLERFRRAAAPLPRALHAAPLPPHR